ncbi:hypothetical protein HPB47_020440 [Ixodes persulcatus]|uniref:Uncharacterized protein n=1 Tax=Ixodes persulcatus TaxID=34615 RepID=A0AC60QFM5_IXOPE|nr:hypothetical protein HPB47_020440 [Ixodes persulcatus]
MSSKTFAKHETTVTRGIETAALESMKKAREEEARLARESGEIDAEGCPLVTVIADGAWSKRPYKNKYDAPSGVSIHTWEQALMGWLDDNTLVEVQCPTRASHSAATKLIDVGFDTIASTRVPIVPAGPQVTNVASMFLSTYVRNELLVWALSVHGRVLEFAHATCCSTPTVKTGT